MGVLTAKQREKCQPYPNHLTPLAEEDVVDAHLCLPGLERPRADLPRRERGFRTQRSFVRAEHLQRCGAHIFLLVRPSLIDTFVVGVHIVHIVGGGDTYTVDRRLIRAHERRHRRLVRLGVAIPRDDDCGGFGSRARKLAELSHRPMASRRLRRSLRNPLCVLRRFQVHCRHHHLLHIGLPPRTPVCQTGYKDNTGCHQLDVFWLSLPGQIGYLLVDRMLAAK
jgi:hypothetical protein